MPPIFLNRIWRFCLARYENLMFFFLVWGGPYSPIQAASFLVNLREKTLSLSVPRNVRNVLSKRFFFVCVVGESFLTFVFIYLRLDFVDVLKAFSFKKKGKITFYARLG